MLKAKRVRHWGIPKHAMLFGSCDIGMAELEDGRTVYTTWGRNLTQTAAEEIAQKCNSEAVSFGQKFELVLPGLGEFISSKGHWIE